MATIGDSFPSDLDDLSDNENDVPQEEGGTVDEMEEDPDGDGADMENMSYDDLDSVSKLQNRQCYIDVMKKVEDALLKENMSNQGFFFEDDPEYQLIVDCNALSVDIENEIGIIHNFIRHNYRLRFPELESLVHQPMDYARVVKKIGNATDLTLVDLEGILPSAITMAVSIAASTTSAKLLPEENLQKTIDACDRALALDFAKKKVLNFVESRMEYISPNLSAIVGSAVAAKLISTAGGLSALAKMPVRSVQLLGAKRKTLAGSSTASSQLHVCFVEQTEIFQSTPPSLRKRACKLLAAKSTFAASLDSTKGDPTGKTGKTLRDEIWKKIEKWQNPPPAKEPKPLHVDSESEEEISGSPEPKERHAVTDMGELAHKMQIGMPEESLGYNENLLENLTIDELKGTTAVAFFNKDGIKVAVDSRGLSEWKQTRTTKWKMEVYNATEKLYVLSRNVVGVIVGHMNSCLDMSLKVNTWALETFVGEIPSVLIVCDYIENYLKNFDGDHSFGTIIAGYDTTEGFQIYRLIRVDKNVKKEKIETFGCLGTGSVYANHYMTHYFDFNLSREDAKELALKSVFNSSYYDKSTDGNIVYCEVTKYTVEHAKRLETLGVYLKYYDLYDETCTLFLIYLDQHRVCCSDVLITHFSKYGHIIAAHCVDHRRSNEKGFYFHRLVFASREAAESAIQHEEHCTNATRTRITDYFSHELWLDKKHFLINKASKNLLEIILNRSNQIVDIKKETSTSNI